MEMILMDSNWPIWKLKDDKGYTVLHHAVLVGIDGKVAKIIEIAKAKDKMSSKEVENWVNAVTDCE